MAAGQLPHPRGWDGDPRRPGPAGTGHCCPQLHSAPAHVSAPTAVLLLLALGTVHGACLQPFPSAAVCPSSWCWQPPPAGAVPTLLLQLMRETCQPHVCAVPLPQMPLTGPAEGREVPVTGCPSLRLQALAQLSCLPSALPAQFPHSWTRGQSAACPRHSTTGGVGTAPLQPAQHCPVPTTCQPGPQCWAGVCTGPHSSSCPPWGSWQSSHSHPHRLHLGSAASPLGGPTFTTHPALQVPSLSLPVWRSLGSWGGSSLSRLPAQFG